MQGNLTSLVLVSMALAGTACNASRISGTYVAHAPTFAEMLKLTQTDNGQINGVLSSVELKQDGGIRSEQTPVSGSADADRSRVAHSCMPPWRAPGFFASVRTKIAGWSTAIYRALGRCRHSFRSGSTVEMALIFRLKEEPNAHEQRCNSLSKKVKDLQFRHEHFQLFESEETLLHFYSINS